MCFTSIYAIVEQNQNHKHVCQCLVCIFSAYTIHYNGHELSLSVPHSSYTVVRFTEELDILTLHLCMIVVQQCSLKQQSLLTNAAYSTISTFYRAFILYIQLCWPLFQLAEATVHKPTLDVVQLIPLQNSFNIREFIFQGMVIVYSQRVLFSNSYHFVYI